jgi:LPS export ABC transporter permease LptG/LPS export ABC transporter permease LptF
MLPALRRLRPTLLDKYIAKEILPPFGLGLMLFTFILLLQQITILTGVLIARSADLPTILRVFLNLLPSIFAVTIPMAFLLGVLLAFGRLASESEIVALRASGVSPGLLLRPVLLLSLLASAATFYVMAVALPEANQSYRRIMFTLVVNKARSAIRPRVFTDDLLPGGQLLMYVTDIPASSGLWKDVFIHDVREPRTPAVILARTGRLVIDERARSVALYLEQGVRYSFDRDDAARDRRLAFRDHLVYLPEDAVFPRVSLSKGDREMTLGELNQRIGELLAQGRPEKDTWPYWVEVHKKFAIPLACVVFGLLGLGLSLGSRKEARSAAFALSIGIIFIYYVLIRLGEQAGDTGLLRPALSMWGADVVLGLAALALLWLNHREAAFDPLDPAHYDLRFIARGLGALVPRRGAAPAPVPGRPVPKNRPVVVVRIPRPSFRIFGLLDRHVARLYLGYLALVLLGFWSIFLLAHFLDLFDDIQQHRVKGAVVLRYYAYYSPNILNLISHVAVLVTTLTTLGVLARRNEITAMKAGGVSVYRASLPVLALGLLGSLLLFAAGEFLLPYTNREANKDFNVIKGRPPQSSSYYERRWILGSDGRFYNYDYLEERAASDQALPKRARPSEAISLHGLSVYDVDAKAWDLRDYLYAKKATWDGFTYALQDGWRRTWVPKPEVTLFRETRSREIEPPAYFQREDKDSDTLPFGELKAQIDALERRGLDVAKLRVQLHRKLAFPAVAVVMTLIGVPFAFTVARRGALYGIGIAIVIAIVYWASLGIFEALGNNGLLPPLLAAWSPNLLFGVAGAYLMLNLET